MIKIYSGSIAMGEILNREIQQYPQQEAAVRTIVADVLARGDEAVLEYSRRFDCPTLEGLRVSEADIDAAVARLDPDFITTLEMARDNIMRFHEKQKRDGFRMEKEGGIVLGQKYTPLRCVGVYVPGGTAAYPSTVLMDVIPAKIAGVQRIVMVTPAQKDGRVRDELLAAARLCGVDEIYTCGGAQAIAALAYGTQSIPAVDKVVGPGNIYVALAKRLVFGKVGIDMIAGPSEILILADEAANPAFVAADLLSQAEHDTLASAVLITTSRELALAVQQQLEVQIPQLPRAEIARTSIDTCGKIIVVETIDEAISISNEIAPEHLEVYLQDPFRYLEQIRNAGSIFLGEYAPEPLGDYFAGPNHTLPTSGSARYASPLSVDDFVKRSSYIYYPRQALCAVGGRIADFATREGLHAHARSITIRMQEET